MRAVLLLAMIGALGCGRSQGASPVASSSSNASAPTTLAPLTETEIAAAKGVVMDFYTAVSTKDCVALPKVVLGEMSAEDCKGFVEEWEKHGATLSSIDSVARDGRDPNALLVTSTLHTSKGNRDQVFRLEHDANGALKVKR